MATAPFPEHMRRISTHRAAVEARAAEILHEKRAAQKVAEFRETADRVLGTKFNGKAAFQHRADGGQYIAHPNTDDHTALLSHLQDAHGVVASPAMRGSTKVAAQVHAAAHGPIIL
jgi:hypothetical protein